MPELPKEMLDMGNGQVAVAIEGELVEHVQQQREYIELVAEKGFGFMENLMSRCESRDLAVAAFLKLSRSMEPDLAFEVMAHLLAEKVSDG